MTATFHKSYLASNSADATASNSGRKLVRDSGGAYHLVYETAGEVYYQKSTDGGSTWNSYKRLSAGNGNNKFPSIAERSGKLYIVWQRKTGTRTVVAVTLIESSSRIFLVSLTIFISSLV